MSDTQGDRLAVINVNVGILGHVDSGKTSLVKALSTLLSTAALDKNPQSQARGITLDLGFSAFSLPMPEHLMEKAGKDKKILQFTLVDCPGHASLIRTIIGGSQIIDMMILVVDANKGIQTQTAECIVIGEITTDKLIIVLNKCDLLPEAEREAKIERMKRRLLKVFNKTKFANCSIIATSAAVGGEKVASIGAKCALSTGLNESSTKGPKKDGMTMNLSNSQGVAELVDLIRASIEIPKRNLCGPLYYAIDHCFSIKGHGTILTGTVLGGSISVGNIIELPHLQTLRKVKSMQMFHKSVRTAGQGDRVGLCVTNLDPKLIERGIAVTPGSIPLLSTAICMVKKVRFFLEECKSNTNFHISIGHTTVAATVLFYGSKEIAVQRLAIDEKKASRSLSNVSDFDSKNSCNHQIQDSSLDSTMLIKNKSKDLVHVYESPNDIGPAIIKSDMTNNSTINDKNKTKRVISSNSIDGQSALNSVYQKSFPDIQYPWESDFEYRDALKGPDESINGNSEDVHWAVLQFQRPVYCPIGSLIIGSRLDTFATNAILEKQVKDGHKGEHASQCRLAFYGPLRESVPVQDMEKIKVFSWKEKKGFVDHLTKIEKNGLCSEFIGCSLVKENGNIQNFIGMKVETERGHLGVIMGPYGSGGNFKVRLDRPVPVSKGSKIILRFKRYIHDKLKVMAQTGIDEYAQERASLIASLSPFVADVNSDGNSEDINGAKKLSNRQKKAEKKALLNEKSSVLEDSFTKIENIPGANLQISHNDNVSIDASVGLSAKSKVVFDTRDVAVALETTASVKLITIIDSNSSDENQLKSSITKTKETILPKKAVLTDLLGPIISASAASLEDGNTRDSTVLVESTLLSCPPSSSVPSLSSSLLSPTSFHSSGTLRVGVIESFKPDSDPGSLESSVVAIVSGAFTREENIRKYKESQVRVTNKNINGELSGPFAKLGKCKILFIDGLNISVGDLVEIDISAHI